MVDPTAAYPEKEAIRQREIENQLSALRAPVAGARAAAARRLGDLQAGCDALLGSLKDPHESVRSAAAQALGSFSGSEKAPEIIDTLLAAIDDPSEKVCQAAIRSLGTLHAEAARLEIEEFLDDSNPFIAGAAVLALARLGAVDLAPRLAAFLHNENSYIRIQSVRAVGLLKYAPAGADIVRMLEETRQERQANGPVDLQTRLEWREDDLYNLQNQLIRAAGDLRLEEAVPMLIETAQKDIGLRGLAIESLIAIGADIAPELVTNLLSDPSVYLRKRLMALITQHNYRQALPQIRPLLRSENASTRSAALQAVTQMNDANSLAEVVWMCFHDSNPFVRVQAVQSLVQLAGKEAVPQLIQLARDANFQVRKAAVLRLVEWEPVEQPILAALARFSAGSPEDELAPVIAAILQKNSFDPAVAADDTKPGLPPIPAELLVEIPNLVVILDRWRMALRQAETAASNPEAQRIEDALSCLISVLNDASHST